MIMQSLNTGLTGKLFKLVLLGLLVGAVGGLVMTDVGGYFRHGGVSRSDVARVGREKISLVDFSRTFRRTLAQSGIPETQAVQMGMPYMILQQEITDRVLRQAAKQSGIRVSDKNVAAELKKQLAKVEAPGSEKEKLQMVLQQQGTTEAEFVELLRNSFAVNLLASAIATSDQQVPALMAENTYRYEHQKRNAVTVQITENSLKTKPQPDDKTLQSYYKENIARYRTPEKRDISFLVIKQDTLIPNVTISDEQAQTYFKEHTTQFMNPDRVRFSQWIAKDEKTAKEIITLHPKAFSDVKKPGVDALASDWYAKPMLNKAMQEALYPAQKTGVIGPVKTDLGWHVLLVESYEAGTAKNFADVKDIIVRELKDRTLDEKLNGVTEQIETLAAGSSTLEPIAQEYKVTAQKIEGLTAENLGNKLKESGASDTVIARLNEAAFSLEENEISPIMDTKDGDMVLAQVTKVTPSITPDFTSIKEQVRTDATQQAVRDAVDNLATQLVRQYDATKPDSWAKAVASLNLSTETFNDLDRNGAVKTLGNEAANLLFTLTPGNAVSSVPNEKGILVIKLQQIVPYTGTIDATSLAQASTRLKTEMAQEIQQEFVTGWRNRLGAGVNDTLMQQYFAPKENENN